MACKALSERKEKKIKGCKTKGNVKHDPEEKNPPENPSCLLFFLSCFFPKGCGCITDISSQLIFLLCFSSVTLKQMKGSGLSFTAGLIPCVNGPTKDASTSSKSKKRPMDRIVCDCFLKDEPKGKKIF